MKLQVSMSFMLLPQSVISPFVFTHFETVSVKKMLPSGGSVLCLCESYVFGSLSIITISAYWCVQQMTGVENPRELVVCNMNISSIWFNMSLTVSYRTGSAVKAGFCTQSRQPEEVGSVLQKRRKLKDWNANYSPFSCALVCAHHAEISHVRLCAK